MYKNAPTLAIGGVDTAENELQKELSTRLLFAEPNRAEYSVKKASYRLGPSPESLQVQSRSGSLAFAMSMGNAPTNFLTTHWNVREL